MIYLDEAPLDYIPSTKGEDVRKFEKAISEYLGVSDCVAVNSGTSALHLALMACGIGRGDVVVVPAITFVATANAVLYTGAKVKIVDIDLTNWLMEQCSLKKVSGALPVNLYGNSYKIGWPIGTKTIIIDSSHDLTRQRWGIVNNYCYSFNGNKTMTTGGGGLIVGDNLEEIRKMIHPAYSNSIAYNYGMPAHNAILGLQELSTLSDKLKKKEEFNKIYREELYFLKFQGDKPGPYWMTACLFPEYINIDRFQLRLEMRGIPTRRIFEPLNHYKHLRFNRWWLPTNWFRKKTTFPNAEYLYKHGLCLPSSLKENQPEDILTVCKTIKELI